MLLSTLYFQTYPECYEYIAHLRQELHNSKFGVFELLVQKVTFADAPLTGIVS